MLFRLRVEPDVLFKLLAGLGFQGGCLGSSLTCPPLAQSPGLHCLAEAPFSPTETWGPEVLQARVSLPGAHSSSPGTRNLFVVVVPGHGKYRIN